MYPAATDAGPGRSGNDLLNTPGLDVEIKAVGYTSIQAQLKACTERGSFGNMPLVIWRHNGQGEASMDDWTVTIRLADFEKMWKAYHDGRTATNPG
jgi:hypothetical protein